MLASPIKHGMDDSVSVWCTKNESPRKLSLKSDKEEKVFKFVQVSLFYVNMI